MLSDSAPSQKLDAKAIDSQVPTYGGEAHAKRTQAAKCATLKGLSQDKWTASQAA